MNVSHAQFVNLDPSAIRIAENVRTDAGYELDSLESLADSIATYGVIQPIVVSRKRGGFELVAGHRRVLAAQMAGLASVPAVVQDVPENERTARQLVENVQRTDLSLADTANAVRALHDEHGSLSLVADMLGKSKPWTCKMLALTADANTSVAMKLIADEIITDLDLAHTFAQIERLGGRDYVARMADEIRAGKHTRASLRKRLTMLKAEESLGADTDDDTETTGNTPSYAKPTLEDLAACLNEACELLRNEADSSSDKEHAAEIRSHVAGYAKLLNALGW